MLTPRLLILIPLGFVLVAGALLAVMLIQLRADAVSAGKQLVESIALLSEEQSSRTIQTVDKSLQAGSERLATMRAAGTATEDSMRTAMRTLISDQPFVRAMWVMDAEGRIVFDTDHGNIGISLADRRYFTIHRDRPQLGFQISVPYRSRSTGGWFLAATRPLRDANGAFAGIIVAALEPHYFDRVWTPGAGSEDRTIALLRRDGTLVMRSPFVDSVMGRSFADAVLFTKHLPAAANGSYENRSPVDGRWRLVGYRTLSTYPDLLIVVGHSVDTILAPWRRMVVLVSIGWLVASAVIGAMSLWLRREWEWRRRSEAHYRTLFEANPNAIGVYEPASLRLIAVNEAAIVRYGWSRDEFLTMTMADLRPPEDVPRLRAMVASMTLNEAVPTDRTRHRLKDGSQIDVEVTSRLIELNGRRVVLALAQDVTEQNLLRARLTDAIEAFPGSFRLFDRDGRLVLANSFRWGGGADSPKIEVGLTYEAMARDAANHEIDTAAVGRSDEWFRERLAEFRGGDTDVEFRLRDGRYLQLLQRHTSDGGTIRVAFDISARKAAEEQLRQAQKMEAVGQITGGVAHDFNNMLTVIIGTTEMLIDQIEDGSETHQMLGLVLRAAEGSAELTRSLLAFARRQPLHPRRIDVGDFIARIEGLLRRSLGEQVDIVRSAAPELWPVVIDPALLEAAVLNLSINARDAMPGGGLLTITTTNSSVGPSSTHLDSDPAPGDYVVVAVSDTGTGMAPEIVARVFEPFFTTKGAGKGTGLGLSMVYGFVRQSGGQVKIDSEVGRGTTISMYLPRASPEQMADESAEESSSPALSRGESILLVEDEALVRDHAAAQLTHLGYQVTVAVDGPDASRILAGAQKFDLLFTDMVMPGGMSGRDLVDAARRLRPGIRVLFTSGYSDDMIAPEAGEALLSKPYRLRELAKKVREVLDAA